MAEVVAFPRGGYRFIKGIFPYSGGIAAEPGFTIERARFRTPLPLVAGFSAVEVHFKSIGRPNAALAACELRSPAAFTEQGFAEFNREYVGYLESLGVFQGGINPVARTNVCPEYGKPPVSSLSAFSYTVPSISRSGGFILSGAGEVREGEGSYLGRIVRRGETAKDAMEEKIRCVVGKMEQRLKALGFGWDDVLSTQAYTVCDIGPLMGEEIAKKGAASGGLTWHFARPPLVELEFEMDGRRATREIVI